MNETAFLYLSADDEIHLVVENQIGHLPWPEGIVFGDEISPRMIYLFHHEDDKSVDENFD